MISHRLALTAPGPGYMHYPADRDFNWFNQITAERLVVKVEGGQRYFVWQAIPGRANEGLDCRVYAYAALKGLLAAGLKLNVQAAKVGAAMSRPTEPAPETGDDRPDEDQTEAPAVPQPAPIPTKKRRRRTRSTGDRGDAVW